VAFQGYLKQSTAVDVLLGPFLDETNGKDAEAGLTLSQGDIKLSKNGQALAQKNDATAAAADANGYYNCELDSTDTNTVGQLTIIVHESGALPVRLDYHIVEEDVYDAMYGAAAAGPNTTTPPTAAAIVNEWETQSQADPTGFHVNVLEVGGTSQTANDNGADINTLLADWVNGGRLDLLLDAIKAVTDAMPDAGALTTIGADTARLTAARAAVLTDLIDGGRLDLILDALLVDTDTTIPGLIAALENLSAAEANAEVVDALSVDTIADLSNGAPPATPTLEQAIMYLYSALRNKIDVDSGFKEYYNNAGTLIWKKALSDDTSNYVEAEGEAGS